MKRSYKLICMLLVLSMLVGLLASCGKKKGTIVAVYDNIPVYEGEVQDIINYQMTMNATNEMTTEELQAIMQNAIVTYVRYKVLEIDLKKKGYTVDEKVLNENLKSTIAYLDEEFEGGYKDWRNLYRVSKDFLKEDLRRYQLAELFSKYASDTVKVTDDELKQYYNTHALDYKAPSGYTWTAVLREILDFNDEAACSAAISEMETYARQINSGYMTLDQVKADLIRKYTEKDGYTNKTQIYSGENFTATADFALIDNLADALEAIKKEYGELNPSADPEKDREAYAKYMDYLGDCFRAEVFYALQNMKVGEVYSKPIKSYAGYFIVRLDKIETKSSFKPFDDVKEEIRTKVTNEKVTAMFEETMTQIEKDYKVSYLFSTTSAS